MKNIQLKQWFFCAFIIIIYNSNAQNVGFMGRKFSIELNTGMGISRISDFRDSYLKNSNSLQDNEDIYGETPFGFNLHPEIILTATIGRKTDFGISVSYDRVKGVVRNNMYVTKIKSSDYYTGNLGGLPASNINYYFYPLLSQKINFGTSVCYQAFLRFYSKKYIAPVGFYTQLGFGYQQIGFKNNSIDGYFFDDYVRRNNPDIINQTLEKETKEPVTIHLRNHYIVNYSFALGYKKTYSNGVYINTGLAMNFIFLRKLKKNSRTNSLAYQLPILIALDFQRSQLFEMKIGVGKIF